MSNKESNKSESARRAESLGERTWTGWRLGLLIDQVLSCNIHGLNATHLRSVRPLEFLKVKLLVRTEPHHVRLLMQPEIRGDKVQYYALDVKKAKKLKPVHLEDWVSSLPSPGQLDEMVLNLTDRVYYRQACK